ncbi:N/A [soil metagenome]
MNPMSGAPDRIDADAGFFGSARRALSRYWQVACRWKAILFSIVVTSLVIGMVVTLMMSTQFTAGSRIEISRDQNSILNARPADGATQDSEFYNTQYALLHARSLTMRVVREMRLAQSEDFFLVHGKTPPGAVGPASPRAPALRAARERLAIEILENHIEIVPVKGSRLIDISYTSRSPVWSAFIVNGWIRQFADANMDRRRASTSGARTFLEHRMDELRDRIAQSDRNAALYASKTGIVAPPVGTQGRAATGADALRAPAGQRPTAASLASQAAAGPGQSEGNNGTLAVLRAKRAEAEAEYARLSVQFKSQYPSVLALARQIRALNDGIAREERRAGAAQAAEIRAAAQRDDRQRNAMGTSQSRLERHNSDTVQYDIYRREADTDRQLYEGYLQRYKQISVADVGATDVLVVDPADVPERPSSPRLVRNMMIATLAGLLLAAGVVMVLERADDGVSETTDMAGLLDIPLLGATPDLPAEMVQDLLSDRDSALSETYRKIWSNLATSADGAPGTLMITSTRQHEGKSTTSLAIALLLARSGKTVALVDADMRNPSMHAYIDAQNEKGLSNLLAGEDDWRALLQPLERGGISFLSAGQLPTGAADLFRGDQMRTLVGQLAQAFDHVIVDAPPMLDLPDAPLISAAVERVIFVIEAQGVGVKAARSALDRLRDADAHIAGGVVTKLSEPNASYHYAKI